MICRVYENLAARTLNSIGVDLVQALNRTNAFYTAEIVENRIAILSARSGVPHMIEDIPAIEKYRTEIISYLSCITSSPIKSNKIVIESIVAVISLESVTIVVDAKVKCYGEVTIGAATGVVHEIKLSIDASDEGLSMNVKQEVTCDFVAAFR